MSTAVATVKPARSVLVQRFADRYGIDQARVMDVLKETAFKGGASNEQMAALLVVADQYHLNPFTKEIYAFPDKHNGIVPVVGVDGWSRIINSHPEFDGMEFHVGEAGKDGLPEAMECVIYRKDRGRPIRVTEWMAEVKRNTGPWNSHPRRMLRHKAMIQCARLSFGFVGIYEQDEAERIVQGQAETNGPDRAARTAQILGRRVVDVEPADSPLQEHAAADLLLAISEAGSLEELDELADSSPYRKGDADYQRVMDALAGRRLAMEGRA